MMVWKEFKDKVEAFGEKINLRNKFPGYFNVWFFRIYYFFLIVLVILALVGGGGNLVGGSVSCPADNNYCFNPFYVCQGVEDMGLNCKPSCPSYVKDMRMCEELLIPAGETFGTENKMIEFGFFWIVAGALITFLLNHVWYKVKRK